MLKKRTENLEFYMSDVNNKFIEHSKMQIISQSINFVEALLLLFYVMRNCVQVKHE